MTDAEALRIVAMLTAYFRQELSDETAVLWASGIRDYELQDAMEATRQLGSAGRFMPALAEFKDAIVEVRNERLMAERLTRSLPETFLPGQSFGEFLKQNPDMRDRVRRLGGPVASVVARIESEKQR